MTNSKPGSMDVDDKNENRNLPSGMNSKKVGNMPSGKKDTAAVQKIMQFSKLMEGVVIVLSGFVNPERSTLRSQALEMGAEYKPDWSSDCTLLVCAFPNTPKFRQVEEDFGTIVSKEWISECYSQKKLVEIDQYLMHAGRPWRKVNNHHDPQQDQEDDAPVRTQNLGKKTAHTKIARASKSKESAIQTRTFSPSKVKEWAIKDLKQAISWLESQEQRPEPDEVKKIAAQGITTCLQDAIEALRQNQDIKDGMEDWMFVPHMVKELAELEGSNRESTTKDELIKLAINCQQIYAAELEDTDDFLMNKKLKPNEEVKGEVTDDAGSDSDATIVMTEEEIDLACGRIENSCKH